MSATMRSSLAVKRSRTRRPTISFSVNSLGTARSWTQFSPRAILRTQSTSAGLVASRSLAGRGGDDATLFFFLGRGKEGVKVGENPPGNDEKGGAKFVERHE